MIEDILATVKHKMDVSVEAVPCAIWIGALAFAVAGGVLASVGPAPQRYTRWAIPGACGFAGMFLMEMSCGWTGPWHFLLSHVLPGFVIFAAGGVVLEAVVAFRVHEVCARQRPRLPTTQR